MTSRPIGIPNPDPIVNNAGPNLASGSIPTESYPRASQATMLPVAEGVVSIGEIIVMAQPSPVMTGPIRGGVSASRNAAVAPPIVIPTRRPSGSTSVINTPETIAPRPVRPENATAEWDRFLGPGPTSNTHPRTGLADPDRLVSAEGTRSIRYGSHEMNGNPTRQHYHEETWTYDPVTDIMTVDNRLVRVPVTNTKRSSMKVLITNLQCINERRLVEFECEYGMGFGNWLSVAPQTGNEYEVELDCDDVLQIGENTQLSNEKQFAMGATKLGTSFTATVEDVYDNGTASLRFGGGIMIIEFEGDFPATGTWLDVSTSRLGLNDIST
jgi:hypothetical protein